MLPLALVLAQSFLLRWSPVPLPGFASFSMRHPIAVKALVLAAASVPPLLVAIRLLRRSRRPSVTPVAGRSVEVRN
jgi:hypothetical protein